MYFVFCTSSGNIHGQTTYLHKGDARRVLRAGVIALGAGVAVCPLGRVDQTVAARPIQVGIVHQIQMWSDARAQALVTWKREPVALFSLVHKKI